MIWIYQITIDLVKMSYLVMLNKGCVGVESK